MADRIAIEDVAPVVNCGRYPAKAVTGEHIPVTATVWREGHDAVSATVVWRGPGDRAARQTRMTELGPEQPDRFGAVVVPEAEGEWTFRVDAWSDPWRTWLHAIEVKVADGQGPIELANDLDTGALLVERVSRRPGRRNDKALLTEAVAALRDVDRPLADRLRPALGDEVRRIMHDHPVRELLTKGRTRRIRVDRERAAFGSWYEFFPRSTGVAGEHGTFATAAVELERVASMGFDVVYLPPIHPIGHENRKGPNNTLVAGPDDVGSPWAIGAGEGGHDAVHPDLGTIDDFDAFVARARELGMEVALDLALQCAPDHPWVLKHPEWFTTRPDGTIAYAENPPKRYQDIYPLNFDNDPEGLYGEVLRVVTHWIDHGVRIFRVDNPHTKPPNFWSWLIERVREQHPDVLFLAEAFTRPARLWGLAKLGFSQSYTYFTWRTGKQELVEFANDLVEHWHEGRPNLFVNTPDILHESLQHGGPGMFALRAALAATLSPTWGVYSGYELFEHQAVRAGSEEYLDSEKYQLRHRDYAGELAAGRSLQPWLTRLNRIRRDHPALHQLRTLRFHQVHNDNLLAFTKQDPATGDTMVVVITLDPHGAQEGTLELDLPSLGFQWHDRLKAHDEVTGEIWDWGRTNFVRLEPWRAVAHIVALRQ